MARRLLPAGPMFAVRSLLMTVLFSTVISAGCLWPTGPSDPLSVVLAPGESAAYRSLSVRFIGVTTDSRCPGDALCIDQGDAVMAIEARIRDAAATPYELRINDEPRRTITHAGYTIHADALAPYPFVSTPIAPGDYRLTLTLERQ